MNDEDRTRRAIITGLMCYLEAEVDSVRFAPEFAKLRDLEADGLLTIDGGHITMTSMGRPLVRAAAPYLTPT